MNIPYLNAEWLCQRDFAKMFLAPAHFVVPTVYVKELKLHAIEKAKEKERKTRHDLRKRDDHWYVLQVITLF